MSNIGFTGHRDKRATEEQMWLILEAYGNPYDNVWHYGAAKDGFDAQVEEAAKYMGTPLVPYPPEWSKHPGKSAAIIRNYQIVDAVDELVAFYDGRTTGGTYKTVEYAISKQKPVHIITPKL